MATPRTVSRPLKILEVRVIEFLLGHGATVVCAGGGGIPVATQETSGIVGVEAVIHKDLTSALVATHGQAESVSSIVGARRAARMRNHGAVAKVVGIG
jgi:carbamate kinase